MEGGGGGGGGEENKLTTFSTWTIMLGCNESNIISSSISANLATPEKQFTSTWSRNEERPTGHYKKYSHFKGETLHQQGGEL